MHDCMNASHITYVLIKVHKIRTEIEIRKLTVELKSEESVEINQIELKTQIFFQKKNLIFH
jgi:hypothetical protein